MTTQETTISQEIESAIQIIKQVGCKAEVTGAWVWAHGNLKANKEARDLLKANGFRFASKKKLWYFAAVRSGGRRGGKSMSYIRTKYGSVRVGSDD